MFQFNGCSNTAPAARVLQSLTLSNSSVWKNTQEMDSNEQEKTESNNITKTIMIMITIIESMYAFLNNSQPGVMSQRT